MCIPQNDEQEPWTWCVIANVVDEHEVGVDHHIEHGTKIFSPGTKVYVSTEWRTSLKDDGGTLFVIGKARKQWRMVGMFIPRNRLTNFRVGRVFDRSAGSQDRRVSGQYQKPLFLSPDIGKSISTEASVAVWGDFCRTSARLPVEECIPKICVRNVTFLQIPLFDS